MCKALKIFETVECAIYREYLWRSEGIEMKTRGSKLTGTSVLLHFTHGDHNHLFYTFFKIEEC